MSKVPTMDDGLGGEGLKRSENGAKEEQVSFSQKASPGKIENTAKAARLKPVNDGGPSGPQNSRAGPRRIPLGKHVRWAINRGAELVADWPMMIHATTALLVTWVAGRLKFNLLFTLLLAILYLAWIGKRQRETLRRRVMHEERVAAARHRPMAEEETCRWLNALMATIWPAFFEKFLSRDFLPSLAPWFFETYKPWQARQVVLQRLFLGSSPPFFANARFVPTDTYNDHAVLELGLEFLAGPDMSAVIAGQSQYITGLGIWGSAYITRLHLEGKFRLGLRFEQGWPFISRIRICFAGAPYVGMSVHPLVNFGFDVTDFPGIASWLDRMLATAVEESLVEPNMLNIDVAKLLRNFWQSPQAPPPAANPEGEFFSVEQHGGVALLVVELLEGVNLKAADSNGLSDPYVKGGLGSSRFRSSMKRKTLNPLWEEEFQLAVPGWDQPNLLVLRVRDKDLFKSDDLGHAVVDIAQIRDGQRHELWLDLKGVSTGMLHLALTVIDKPPPPCKQVPLGAAGMPGSGKPGQAGSKDPIGLKPVPVQAQAQAQIPLRSPALGNIRTSPGTGRSQSPGQNVPVLSPSRPGGSSISAAGAVPRVPDPGVTLGAKGLPAASSSDEFATKIAEGLTSNSSSRVPEILLEGAGSLKSPSVGTPRSPPIRSPPPVPTGKEPRLGRSPALPSGNVAQSSPTLQLPPRRHADSWIQSGELGGTCSSSAASSVGGDAGPRNFITGGRSQGEVGMLTGGISAEEVTAGKENTIDKAMPSEPVFQQTGTGRTPESGSEASPWRPAMGDLSEGETHIIDVGMGELGAVAIVRPGEQPQNTVGATWQNRTGGRRNEAAIISSFLTRNPEAGAGQCEEPADGNYDAGQQRNSRRGVQRAVRHRPRRNSSGKVENFPSEHLGEVLGGTTAACNLKSPGDSSLSDGTSNSEVEAVGSPMSKRSRVWRKMKRVVQQGD